MHGARGYGGGSARQQLEHMYSKYTAAVLPRGSMPEAKRLVQMYEAIPKEYRGALWLFREPRGVVFVRSRWKQLAKYFGVASRVAKKVFLVGRTNVQNIPRAPERGPRPRILQRLQPERVVPPGGRIDWDAVNARAQRRAAATRAAADNLDRLAADGSIPRATQAPINFFRPSISDPTGSLAPGVGNAATPAPWGTLGQVFQDGPRFNWAPPAFLSPTPEPVQTVGPEDFWEEPDNGREEGN